MTKTDPLETGQNYRLAFAKSKGWISKKTSTP